MEVSLKTDGGGLIPVRVQEKLSECLDAPSLDEWMAEHLSSDKKQIYGKLMQTRYATDEDFPVDFDDLWLSCGYSRKDHGLTVLRKHFVENTDYVFLPSLREKSGQRGLTATSYAVTVKCAQEFALLAGTEEGKQIRTFLVDCMAVIQDYHILTLIAAERKKASTAQKIEWKPSTHDMEEHHRILDKVGNHAGFYAGMISEDEFKVGLSYDKIGNRAKKHGKTFKHFALFYACESDNPYLIEKKVLEHPLVAAHRQVYTNPDGSTQREITKMSPLLTKSIFIRTIEQIEAEVSDTGRKCEAESLAHAKEITKQEQEKTKQAQINKDARVREQEEKTKQLKLRLKLAKIEKLGVDAESDGESTDDEVNQDPTPPKAADLFATYIEGRLRYSQSRDDKLLRSVINQNFQAWYKVQYPNSKPIGRNQLSEGLQKQMKIQGWELKKNVVVDHTRNYGFYHIEFAT